MCTTINDNQQWSLSVSIINNNWYLCSYKTDRSLYQTGFQRTRETTMCA